MGVKNAVIVDHERQLYHLVGEEGMLCGVEINGGFGVRLLKSVEGKTHYNLCSVCEDLALIKGLVE